MKRLVAFIRLYWKTVIAPLGTFLIAIAVTRDVQELHPLMERACVVVGGLITIYGAILASELTTSNKDLRDRLAEGEKLRNDRIFLILAAFKDEFQIELNYHLLKIASARGLVVQVFCPSEDFSSDAQRDSQDRILKNAGQ